MSGHTDELWGTADNADNVPSTDAITDQALAPDQGLNGFRFLDLPAELRNDIYSLAMPGANDIKTRDLATLKFPAITRASRQLRQESLAFLFAECNFVICVGSNFHHRPTSRHRKYTPADYWSPTTDSGTLGFRPSTRKFLKSAGNAVLFTDITFNIFDSRELRAVRYELPQLGKYRQRENKLVVAMALKRATGKLEFAVTYGPYYDRGPMGGVGFCAQEVDDTLRETRLVVDRIAARANFKGLTMSDIHKIAKTFCYKSPAWG